MTKTKAIVKKIVLPVADALFSEIKNLIDLSRKSITVTVNRTLTELNWNIGRIIHEYILQGKRAGYGEQILATLSPKLTAEFGQGYNASSLNRMLKFYRAFSDADILATLSPKLSWSHFVELITLEEEVQRRFYAQMSVIEGWSVRLLRDRIDSMLFERTALSKKPEKLIKKELQKITPGLADNPDMVFRDPYFLDFLGLKDAYSERDLENAILIQLQKFIIELGSDFAFLARQKRIIIDGIDYRIDLLFYHRGLKCLVAIDLKLGRFQASDKGQMDLYLRWLEKHEQRQGENNPVGLILCSGKSDEHVELMLLKEDRIKVAQYYTQLPPLELLKEKLHKAIEIARHKEDIKNLKLGR